MDKWELLSLLKDKQNNGSKEKPGSYVSGEAVSDKFGISRMTVWKCIKELKSDGYEIESKTNNGYKLLPGFDILNEYEIRSRLKEKNIEGDYNIIYKSETESTNSDAKKINSGENAVTVIVSPRQTAGKGRYGRIFYSGIKGLYFTIKINSGYSGKSFDIADITFFPLIAACAVNCAVRDLCEIDLTVKWPNDLLYKIDGSYKKVCGILTEASVEAENRGVSYVIIGVGLNVNNEIPDFSENIRNIAASLKIISGKKYERADILCGVIENFTRFMNMPRKDLLEEYKKRLLTGVRISFAQNGRKFNGTALGINEKGGLIAELENGEITTIQSGEIEFI